jgi:signal transduction histidine kinase
MRRFRLLFVAFSAAILVLVALLVHRALQSVEIERQMRHQAIAERVFDEMERALSRLLEEEEARPFEGYGADGHTAALPFVVGHFQINPDGSIRGLPARASEGTGAMAPQAASRAQAKDEIERTVAGYWRSDRDRAGARAVAPAQLPGTTVPLGEGLVPLAPRAATESRGKLAAKKEPSAFDALRALNKGVIERQRKAADYDQRDDEETALFADDAGARGIGPQAVLDAARSETELPPMIGRAIDPRHVLLYRTVVRDTRGYRQGLLLDVELLGIWLREQGLGGDGLAEHASVSFATPFATVEPISESFFVYQHRFAEPFEGLSARLSLRPLPGLGSATYVYALSVGLLATGVLGLAALYRMVSVVMSYAERRSNFVAAVSHELKTPLTAIRMYAEMLRDGIVPSDAKRNEYYRHITVESERLSRLVNNVLELSRLEKGAREVTLTTGSVAPVAREVADLLRPHVEGEGFELRLEIEPDLPPVRFERDALMQVLCNLVDNAVKYARDAATKEIVLACRHDGGGVSINVRDHGPGVSSRHLGKIFEPFYRGESELTRRNKGTGIGLALVRGLVERMGARASGRNLPEGGFEVEIAFRKAT